MTTSLNVSSLDVRRQARASRRTRPSDRPLDASAALRASGIDGHVANVVAGWPPLTREQIDALAVVFAGAGTTEPDASTSLKAA